MVVKKILMIIAILISSTFSAIAQSLEIAFALPSDNGRLRENTAKMLRSKLLPAMTENGVEPAEVSSIAIKPEISFVNKQVVEGGMRNIHTSDIQFNFMVHPTFRVIRQSCSAYSLSLKYRSSLNPYALRFITFILLLIPSTLPVEIWQSYHASIPLL